MKKILFLFAVLLTAVRASAYDFEVGGIYYNVQSEEDKTCVVTYKDTNYNSYTGDVVIPASVTYSGRTYSVTTIRFWAFYDCSGLTSVKIGNSVTKIGSQAFWKCSSLTSVEIPNSVTRIGDCAFQGCSSLTSVEIPNSVTEIEDDAFKECPVENYVCDNQNYLSYFNSTVKYLTIGHSVTEIGERAFQYCTGLTSVNIPNSVTRIGDCAFQVCSSLTSVEIPNSVTEIGYGAFSGCSSLTSMVIPNSVKTIGSEAFRGCTSLTSVEIPNSVTEIGNYAFYECSGLTSVEFNAINCSIMGSSKRTVFSGCNKLNKLTIGDNVKIIPQYAFSGCESLTSVEIPNSVTEIGDRAFDGTKVENYTCDNEKYLGYFNSSVKNVVIGNSVINIPEKSFYQVSNLTSVVIPNSVTEIGDWAFYRCSGLTSVVIGNSVTEIGYEAFNGCSSLTSVVIGNSVTRIGIYAFANCSSLKEIISLNTTPPRLVTLYDSFDGVSKSDCVVKVPAEAVDAYKRANGWKDFYNIVAIEDELGETEYPQFDPDKLYTLGTARGYLPNSAALTDLWGSGYIVSTEDEAEAGLFRITGDKDKYQLLNTSIGKYLSANGTPTTAYVDEPDGTFSIVPATEHGGSEGKWIIKSNETGKWLMFGGSNQFLNNDGWKTADDGDQWTIEEASDVTVLIDSVNGSESTIAPMYNIFGQRVGDGYRGIIIRGGKKILQK